MFVCLVVVHACACIRTHSTSFPFSYLQIAPVVVRVCVESSHTSSWFERPSLNGLRLSIRVQNCHFFESPLWWIFVSVLCSISLNCFHFWGKKKSFLPFVSQTFFFFVHFSNLWDHFRINLLRHTYACCRRSLCAPIGHADRIDRNWLTPKCVRFHRSLCFRLIDHPNRSRVLTLTSSQSIHHLIDHRQLWSFNPLTIVFWILTHVDWKKSHTHTHTQDHILLAAATAIVFCLPLQRDVCCRPWLLHCRSAILTRSVGCVCVRAETCCIESTAKAKTFTSSVKLWSNNSRRLSLHSGTCLCKHPSNPK